MNAWLMFCGETNPKYYSRFHFLFHYPYTTICYTPNTEGWSATRASGNKWVFLQPHRDTGARMAAKGTIAHRYGTTSHVVPMNLPILRTLKSSRRQVLHVEPEPQAPPPFQFPFSFPLSQYKPLYNIVVSILFSIIPIYTPL